MSDVGSAVGYGPGSIATFSGKFVCPLNMKPEDIYIEDIAHALSNICRFGGHSIKFYSVAQHSVIGAEEISKITFGNISVSQGLLLTGTKLKLAFLLHDAAEAYLCDLPRPIKYLPELVKYREAINNLETILDNIFNINITHPKIKMMDDIMLAAEKRDVMPDREWSKLPPPISRIIEPWTPIRAEQEFLKAYKTYTEGE